MKAGLPNITGSFGWMTGVEGVRNVSGSIYTSSLSFYEYSGHTRSTGESNVDFKIDASRSSSVYQDNAPVRPLSITTAFLMKY